MTVKNPEKQFMAGRKKSNMDRDRVEFKADPAWIKRVNDEAKRSGYGGISAFIRVVVTEYMDHKDAERKEAKKK